ncbi:hypothetical protein [Sphingobacterium gobiense]|uniref:Uncharacterized protein n=1 Tax=Sphingobacterium gobiense TaxID=1382456 RepID=A0A2S9JUA9_9SPHI|nr:hypothetical protein [Sphingobacterium gobiense]PRD56721.1 hypothetical protein C5749_05685 [Sphingobacterium gobiense]
MGKTVSLKLLKHYSPFGIVAALSDNKLESSDKLMYPVSFDIGELKKLREAFTIFNIKDTADYNTIFSIYEDYVSLFFKIKRFGDSHIEIIALRDTQPTDKEWEIFEERYREYFEKE